MRKLRALLVSLAVIGGLIATPGTAQAANFTLTQTVVGNGSVTSGDGFIDCPGTCTHSYSNVPAPVVVVLTEHPGTGATFDHWNGSVCEGDVTVTCQITMSNTRSITATFNGGGGGGGDKFVIIMMENHQRNDFNSTNAPFMTTFASQGREFTNYREGTASGPSLPDYLQVGAGSSCGKTNDQTSFSDNSLSSPCPTTVWNQLQTAGVSWAGYMEAMPSACFTGGSNHEGASGSDGDYAIKHNPMLPFPSVADSSTLCNKVKPYSALNPAALEDVVFITPNLCNDMHGESAPSSHDRCVKNTQPIINRGDEWLAAEVPPLLNAGATVFITFDESGVLYAAMQGPGIPNETLTTAYTHYNLLAAIENRYTFSRLNNASGKTPLPID